jgi:hypothetical protein
MPITKDENSLTSAGCRGWNPRGTVAGVSNSTASQDNLEPREHQLMEEVLSREKQTWISSLTNNTEILLKPL